MRYRTSPLLLPMWHPFGGCRFRDDSRESLRRRLLLSLLLVLPFDLSPSDEAAMTVEEPRSGCQRRSCSTVSRPIHLDYLCSDCCEAARSAIQCRQSRGDFHDYERPVVYIGAIFVAAAGIGARSGRAA